MRKMRKIIAVMLLAATFLTLVGCNLTGNGGDTGNAGSSGNNGPAPSWPDPQPVEAMVFPEPTGDVTYTKIKVTGDMVTSSTPWNNGSDVATNAFDGNTGTFFDGLEGGWITVDLGERVLIGKIAYAPRAEYETRLQGGIFFGSVDGVVWTKIYTIRKAVNSLTEVTYEDFNKVSAYRYIKYQNNNECANISEIVLYSATNISPSLIVEPDRQLYEDGTAVVISDSSVSPESLGMTKLAVTSNDAAAVDNNPSTLATDTSSISVDLGGAYTVGAIAFVSDESSVGGKFYGVRENGDRDLLWEITADSAPTARITESIVYGKLKTTGSYTTVVFEQTGACNLAEIAVYSMDMDTTIPLTALPFATSLKSDNVDSVALNWGSPSIDATSYEIYRKRENGEFKLVYTGTGTSWQDYSLPLGTYTYEVRLKYGDTVIKSDAVTAVTRAMPEDYRLYQVNNQTGGDGGGQPGPSGYYDGEKYYTYSVSVSNSTISVTESSSDDGYKFGNTRSLIPASADPNMRNARLESIKQTYVAQKNTVIIAAHWESASGGYGSGYLFLVTGTPGGEFHLRMIGRPCDVEVRDMSIFVDDDGTAYLLAAANKAGVDSGANASTYVFKFKDDLSGIEKVAARLFPEMYREMPNIIKIDGWYYFFTSQTSGWAPSAGAYAVSHDITDPNSWSELRSIGNTSTFGSQSSWIRVVGSGEDAKYMMYAYRWGPAQGQVASGTMLAPITFSNGVAFYDYFPYILINDEYSDMIPVTNGILLSQDAEVTTTLPSTSDNPASNIVDGDYMTAYVGNSATWPYAVTIDLGRECDISNIQISWYIMKGSEAFYAHKISGSTNGKKWEEITNATSLASTSVTKAVGFNSHLVKNATYRYIKIEVVSPYRWNDASWDNTSVYGEALGWYTPTLYEVKVYGTDPSFKNTAYDDPVGTPDSDNAGDGSANTAAVNTDAVTDDKKSGCSSTLGAAAAVTALVSVFGCAIIKKRRD